MRALLLFLSLFAYSFVTAQVDNTDLSTCLPEWTFFETGHHWGLQGMVVADIDLDGIEEVVTTAEGIQEDLVFWQIAEFSTEEQAFVYSYRSNLYDPAQGVKRLAVEQVDADPQLEILIVTEDNRLVQHDGISFEVERSLSFPFTDVIHAVIAGDANNDGSTDIIISDEEHIHFFNLADQVHLESLVFEDAHSIAIADPDNDGQQEFVTSSGEVYHWDGSQFTIEWNAPYNDESIAINHQVYLEDIDSDDIPEIIIGRRSNIVVSDGDTQTQKYNRFVDFYEKIHLSDANGDGQLEFTLTYNANEFKVYTADNGTRLDTYGLPWTGWRITALGSSDFDNDGEVEVLIGNVHYLQQYDLAAGKVEWLSDRCNAPIFRSGTVQFDEDPAEEIYAVSLANVLLDSVANDYGTLPRLYVFDGATNELQWRSPVEFFLSRDDDLLFDQVAYNEYDFVFTDLNEDQVDDIIFAYHRRDSTSLTAYDALSKDLLHSGKVELDQFGVNIHLEEPIDIDQNGTMDLLLFGENEGFLVLDSLFNVKAFFDDFQLDNEMHKIGNVDDDPQLEVVMLRNQNLQVVDGLTLESWRITDEQYFVFDLYDLNGNGQQEIIAAFSSSNSTFDIYDGTSRELITEQSYDLPSAWYRSLEVVDGSLDDMEFYLGGSSGALGIDGYFAMYVVNGNVHFSPGVGRTISVPFEPVVVSDTDQSGYRNVFVSSFNSIAEFPEICFTCAEFDIPFQVEQPNCLNEQLGRLDVDLSNAFGDVELLWSDGSSADSLTMLSTGEYSVTVSNDLGCVSINEATLSFTPLTAAFTTTTDCNNTRSGSITAVADGNQPLEWLWGDGETTSDLTNLHGGWYQVTLTDQASCVIQDSILVPSSTLRVELATSIPDCFGVDTALAWIDTLINAANPVWQWSTGEVMVDTIILTQNNIYTIEVMDTLGCSTMDGFILEFPEEIEVFAQIDGDIVGTPELEGSVELFMLGGSPPFTFSWQDLDSTTVENTRTGMAPGDYTVFVKDDLGCSVEFQVTVPLITSTSTVDPASAFYLFPNPVKGGQSVILSVPTSNLATSAWRQGPLSCVIISSDGRRHRNIPLPPGADQILLPTEGLASGTYTVIIESEGQRLGFHKLLVL